MLHLYNVHAFIASRVDYCNTVLTGSPRFITGRLQRVLNAAARVITGTQKFYRGLSDHLHSELHWPDIHQRVQYKLRVTIYRCLQNRAPQYLDCCVHTSNVSSRQRLRSANRRQLVVPRHRRSKFGRRSFSVAAPMVWNSFPDSLRDPTLSIDNFRSALKTHLFAAQGTRSALKALHNALYKSTAAATTAATATTIVPSCVLSAAFTESILSVSYIICICMYLLEFAVYANFYGIAVRVSAVCLVCPAHTITVLLL